MLRYFLVALVLVWSATAAIAHANYTGRSGAPTRQTCASSCHGQTGGNVSITGFPVQYTPGEDYLLTIQRASGNSIRNFNASCRVGTGSVNAGVITAGTNTATYNVTGETNGVHLSTQNQASATFNWTAPSVGTGTVTLYCGAYQGSSYNSGLNTTIVLVSDEAAGAPQSASNPSPAGGAQNVSPTVVLSWTAGAGAESHDVYFGTEADPPLIGNQANAIYDPPGDLQAGVTYYWRIDERNAVGVTPGSLWSFTTISLPGQAFNPAPLDAEEHVLPAVTLTWSPGNAAASHDVYFGPDSSPLFVGNQAAASFDPPGALQAGTLYYWRIDERNAAGFTPGITWTFTTLSLPDQASDPHPANLSHNVPVLDSLTWSAGTGTDSHFVYLGLTTAPPLVFAGVNTSFVPATDLEYDTVYYWRIDEHNAAGITQGEQWVFNTESESGAKTPSATIPEDFVLGPAAPNPFNSTVRISYALPVSQKVRLSVSDVTGREVALLVDDIAPAGVHSITWSPEALASGVYFVRLQTPDGVFTLKVVELK